MSDARPDSVAAGRVELRPVPAELVRILADPEAAGADSPSWAPGYPLPGSRVAARNIARQAGDGRAGRWGMFQIVFRESGQVIGDIGFHGPLDDAGTVEIGYGIVEQYRGRGLAAESAAAVCALAWSQPEVRLIIARTEASNPASAGVLRRAGFHADGAANPADGQLCFSLARPVG